MSFPNIPKFQHSIIPSMVVLLLGLFVAQVIATLQVYVSDLGLHRTLLALKEAGYLIVPNQHILPRLLSFESAFWGGLFFTLSIGVFLTFLSWSAAWAWDRLFSRNRLFLFFCLLAWLTSLALINGQGFCILITLYFLFIPPTVFVTAAKLSPQRKSPPGYRSLLLPVPLLLLALLWATQANSGFFLNLRDRLLLSNSLGSKVSGFYYEYAYYPAEVFKSLDQKLLKSCSIGSIQRKPIEQALERTLIVYDYLPLDGTRHVADLVVREDNDRLFFQHDGKTIVQTSLQDFLASPGKLLEELSQKTDTCSPFRRFTLFSLLVSLPLALYAVCFSLFYFIISFVLLTVSYLSRHPSTPSSQPPAASGTAEGGLPSPPIWGRGQGEGVPRISAWIASFLCLILGTALFFYVRGGVNDNSIELARALTSDQWETRVSALKLIDQKKLEIGDFGAYPTLIKSRHVAERYWLVRTLGSSRRTSTYRDLLSFLDDPNPGVVSMAFYALGQRRDSRAVPEILKRVETSRDWYNQWYAYRALRNLGWKQSRSK
jgi:HEAT repeats